jgi:leader peptidase (prepilin peptidase)/N-methyltransferase
MAAIGWGEASLLAIAGGFVGWQPIIIAGLLGLTLGLIAGMVQWAVTRRQQMDFGLWVALAVGAVGLGWYWIGPLVQGLFFNQTRLLLFAALVAMSLLVLAAGLRFAAMVARRRAP